MTPSAIALISTILTIIGTLLERYYDQERLKKKEKDDLDNAISEKDITYINESIIDLHDRLRERNRRHSRQ